jgi:hypothetical protein
MALKRLKMTNNDILNDLYNWIEQNYRALTESYANWDNPNNIKFALYCVAMYVKHQSITK